MNARKLSDAETISVREREQISSKNGKCHRCFVLGSRFIGSVGSEMSDARTYVP